MTESHVPDVPASGVDRDESARTPALGDQLRPWANDNTAALRHGAASPRMLAPIADGLREWIVEAAPWTSQPVFAATVQAWSWAEAECQLRRAWADEHALSDDEGTPRPGDQRWDRAETRAANLRAQLGLDPTSWARLLRELYAMRDADPEGLDELRRIGQRILESRSDGR